MDELQLATVLAEGSYGAGMGAGIGIGLVIGMGAFGGGGHLKKKKLQNQLAAAIETGEISILDKNGKSVTVCVSLVRTVLVHTNVSGLLIRQLGQLGTKFGQMQTSDLLVKLLWKNVRKSTKNDLK